MADLGEDSLRAPIAPVLCPYGVGGGIIGVPSANRLHYLDLLAAQRVGVHDAGRLHGDQGEQLKQVILHHVAHDARPVIVARAISNIDLFGNGDLHAVHVVTIPDRLKDGVGEPEHEQVLHGLLAKVVVDSVHLALVEYPVHRLVQGLGRGEGPSRTASR